MADKACAEMWGGKWKLNTATELQFFRALGDMAQEMMEDTHDAAQWYRMVDRLRRAYAKGYADCVSVWKQSEGMEGESL